MRAPVLALVAVALSAACLGGSPGTTPSPPSDVPDEAPKIRLEPLVDGLSKPMQFLDRGDGSFLIVEQDGLVRIWQDGEIAATPFLDLRARVSNGYEQGLLGLALDPDYAANGRFFVDYTDQAGDTQIVRYTRSTLDPDRADPLSAKTVLSVKQPAANHNGGLVIFGPDGYLYVGLGDGGDQNDEGQGHAPGGNGQSKETLLGKILRIDVSGDGYTVPSDNPFVGGGGRPEIWAYGLRNPWRFSFDKVTGDLYIGDVGQGQREEIDFAPRSSGGGENYGWNVFEGSQRFRPGEAQDPVPPVAEYAHEQGRLTVVGGYVYRGDDHPTLRGFYFYGDFGSGTIWALAARDGRWQSDVVLESGRTISSFAEDDDGQIYVLDLGGTIHRLVEQA